MIIDLFIASQAGEKLQAVESIQLHRGAGILGDRNFNKSQWPGQNITFIDAEAVAVFNRDYKQAIECQAMRRNVVTRGIDLNALVGKTFSIGGLRFRGVELCEPCRALGLRLANEGVSSAEVVKAFLFSGGLRADVCSDGQMSIGMAIDVDAP